MVVEAKPDSILSVYIDTGCAEATKYLEHESCCLDCPFDTCVDDIVRRRPNKGSYDNLS